MIGKICESTYASALHRALVFYAAGTGVTKIFKKLRYAQHDKSYRCNIYINVNIRLYNKI